MEFFSVGVSLVLLVVGLRRLGTARTGVYFSVGPFIGAILVVAMGEVLTLRIVLASLLMALGLMLHMTERHEQVGIQSPLFKTKMNKKRGLG